MFQLQNEGSYDTIEHVLKQSLSQSLSPSTDHQFNLWSVDGETDCRDSLLNANLWSVDGEIQNGGRYSGQIACLHFLYDSNNTKLSIHKVSCFYDTLNNLATNRSTSRAVKGHQTPALFKLS